MTMSNYIKILFKNRSDEKYTPGYAVLPIIKYIPTGKIIWCPFDTEHSEFVIKLKEAGFVVENSHIQNGQDFFEYEPPRWDIIISNPPFSKKVEVFERCLNFGKPFALLMSNYWLNNSAPYRLFKDSELQFLMFDKRIQFDRGKSVPFNCSYFCHALLPKQVIFEALDLKDKSLSRMYGDMEKIPSLEDYGVKGGREVQS
ncbi:tRNA (adenine-N(6)-)-methyltransferase [Phocaeicola sp.]